jgi:hypothetical protein
MDAIHSSGFSTPLGSNISCSIGGYHESLQKESAFMTKTREAPVLHQHQNTDRSYYELVDLAQSYWRQYTVKFHCYDRLASASTMTCREAYKSAPESAQEHLENARSLLLRTHIREKYPTRRQLLLEPAKKIWPEGESFLRKEIAPRHYTGKIRTIYSANKHKQKALQLYYSPTKRLQAQLKAKCHQAEVKAKADTAAAKRRLRRAVRRRGKNRETQASERDWMAELGHGMDTQRR